MLEMSLKLCWLYSKTLTWSCETDIKSFKKHSGEQFSPDIFILPLPHELFGLSRLFAERNCSNFTMILKNKIVTRRIIAGPDVARKEWIHQKLHGAKGGSQRIVFIYSFIHSFTHFVIDQKCHCTISGGPCRSIPSKLLCQTGRHKWSVLSHLNLDPSNQNKLHHNLFQSWYWRNSGDSYLCARRHELTMWAL